MRTNDGGVAPALRAHAKITVSQFTEIFLSARYPQAMELLESARGREIASDLGGWHNVTALFTCAYEAHMSRGNVYAGLGMMGKALREYSRALEAGAVAGLEDRRIRDAHEKCIEAEFADMRKAARD